MVSQKNSWRGEGQALGLGLEGRVLKKILNAQLMFFSL